MSVKFCSISQFLKKSVCCVFFPFLIIFWGTIKERKESSFNLVFITIWRSLWIRLLLGMNILEYTLLSTSSPKPQWTKHSIFHHSRVTTLVYPSTTVRHFSQQNSSETASSPSGHCLTHFNLFSLSRTQLKPCYSK